MKVGKQLLAFSLTSLFHIQAFNPTTRRMSSTVVRRGYVDVHAHLIHEKFEGKEDAIAQSCIDKGMDHVIVNGIEPVSNRKILAFCEKFSPYMLPAVGIYPLDAANQYIYSQSDVDALIQEHAGDSSFVPPVVNWNYDFPRPERFNVEEEIEFIEELAKQKKIVAIGECGLDKHYVTDEKSFAEQERVLRKLMKVCCHCYPYLYHFCFFIFFTLHYQ